MPIRREIDAYFDEAEPLLANRRVSDKGHPLADCPECKKTIQYERTKEGYLDIRSPDCRCHPELILNALTALEARKAGRPTEAPANGHEKAKGLRFPLLTFQELCSLPPPIWHVEDLFLEETVVQVFGETNHGKSLVVWDLACNTCKGSKEWFGRKIVKHGPVVWINADGGRGLTLRANAWAVAHGADFKYPLLTLMGSVQINKADQMGAFRQQLAAMEEKPVLVVVDTQSRCMPGGDENDTGIMTQVTEGLHRLKTEIGCTVVLIHHTDKTGQWERGSGVVKNEADTQIRVSKDLESGIFTVSCRKQRDGADRFADFYFTLQPVEESVIIVQSETGPDTSQKPKKTDKRHQMVQIILNEPGVTYEQCSERLECSLRTVKTYADELKALKVIVARPVADGGEGRPSMGLYPNPGNDTDCA